MMDSVSSSEREKKLAYMREYYKSNKAKILSQIAVRTRCNVCNQSVLKANMCKHVKTMKHINNQRLAEFERQADCQKETKPHMEYAICRGCLKWFTSPDLYEARLMLENHKRDVHHVVPTSLSYYMMHKKPTVQCAVS